jgi:hypothetical protein
MGRLTSGRRGVLLCDLRGWRAEGRRVQPDYLGAGVNLQERVNRWYRNTGTCE